ncbi:hypothetical protein Tco_0893348 [Tanacetum coccineum]|uniref:Uncharacterized protein n=1 Tax=Tanacetum coccineum TaxID=301880 RepID=A0ABQ5C8N6_9ASTR
MIILCYRHRHHEDETLIAPTTSSGYLNLKELTVTIFSNEYVFPCHYKAHDQNQDEGDLLINRVYFIENEQLSGIVKGSNSSWEWDELKLKTSQEVDINKKTENQAKMTKLSMEWKRMCKIKAKVQKCQSQSQY